MFYVFKVSTPASTIELRSFFVALFNKCVISRERLLHKAIHICSALYRKRRWLFGSVISFSNRLKTSAQPSKTAKLLTIVSSFFLERNLRTMPCVPLYVVRSHAAPICDF